VGMTDQEPGELKEIDDSRLGCACFLLVALAAAVIVVVVLRGLPPILAGMAPSPTMTSVATPLQESAAAPDSTPTHTSTASPTATPLRPTATPLPPTATSTATHTPTATPLSPPTTPAQGPPSRPAITTRQEWGAREITEGYIPHTVQRITLHHDGEEFYGEPLARLRGLQSSSIGKGWVDIPYHFLIDLEGNIYEGRPLEFVGDTGTEYDPTGHALIAVMGNYEIQQVNESQLGAIVDLASWLCHEYYIPPQLIRGHIDYAATACPGANLYQYLTNGYIVSAVEGRLRVANQ